MNRVKLQLILEETRDWVETRLAQLAEIEPEAVSLIEWTVREGAGAHIEMTAECPGPGVSNLLKGHLLSWTRKTAWAFDGDEGLIIAEGRRRRPCDERLPELVERLGLGPGRTLTAHTSPARSIMVITGAAPDAVQNALELGPHVTVKRHGERTVITPALPTMAERLSEAWPEAPVLYASWREPLETSRHLVVHRMRGGEVQGTYRSTAASALWAKLGQPPDEPLLVDAEAPAAVLSELGVPRELAQADGSP